MADKALHVLFLADAVFQDLPGGSRVVARELAQGLAARGHRLTFLVARQTPDAPDDETQGGIRIVRYAGAGQGRAFIRSGRDACAHLLKTETFDVAHTHFAYAAVGPLQALPSSIPRVRTFHGPWDEEGWIEAQGNALSGVAFLKERVKKRLRYQIERGNLRTSRSVTVLSECFRKDVVDRFGVPSARVHKIVGGVDSERFQPPLDRRSVRQALGLSPDRPLLFTVRRLAARMGLDNLIQAMPGVVSRHPNTLLLIGGKGPERERLEGLIQKTAMGDHVRLLGFIPDDRLASYYQAADAFILPTLALEGFGLVTTESLACGTPVLGTPVGATPEILNQLDTRLVLPGVSPEKIAQGVVRFLERGGEWGLAPERLHRFARDNFNWDTHADEMEQVYYEAARVALPRARTLTGQR